MSEFAPFEVHPFASAFQLIEGDEFTELVADIKCQGLREPIVLNHDGTVLIDGRNRYRACLAANVDPIYEYLPERYTEPMILDFIVSANVRRRDMTIGQRAFVALEYERRFAKATQCAEKARKMGAQRDPTLADPPKSEDSGWSRERASRAANTSTWAVKTAKAVERDAKDLVEQVINGTLTLDAAEKERKKRVRNQPKAPKAAATSPLTITLLTHDGTDVQYPIPKGKATFNETPGEGISWAAWSWNPVTGCLHGCTYCYARELATSRRLQAAFPAGFTPLFHHERLDAPANTTIPAARRDDPAYQRVFVCSMADLYGKWVPKGWIEQIHDAMIASPQWEYLLLTKFPSRYTGLTFPDSAWVGTSVDTQRRVAIAERAMRKVTDVKVKWLSLEPLLEPLRFSDLSMFDWVVIGAQTQTRQPDGVVPAFAPRFEWVARIVDQAREAGCKVHLKPNLLGSVGPDSPGMDLPNEYPVGSMP